MSAHQPAPSSSTPAEPRGIQAAGSRAAGPRRLARRVAEAELPAWWQGLVEGEEGTQLIALATPLSEAHRAPVSASGSEREPVGHEQPVAAVSALVFDPGSSPLPAADRFDLYAQATQSDSDAAARISVSKMPPWSVALLGLLGGGALVALASGGKDSRVVNLVWTTTQSATAEANTRLMVDASRLESVDPRHELRLSGPGEVQVLGWKADGVVKADNLLTGTLYVATADDGQADQGLKVVTGSGNTTLQLQDSLDIVHVDAAKLPATSRLTVQGEVGRLVVSNLTAVLDATGLVGVTEIYTTALPDGHPQLKSLQVTNSLVSVLTGESSSSVTSGRANEIVAVNAAELDTGLQLTTSGQGRFIVTNFADSTLRNDAVGGLDATLGKTGMQIGVANIESSTDATIYNGAMRDGDVINLSEFGTDAPTFTVNGLKANLDAGNTTGLIEVVTADASDDRIEIETGAGDLSLTAAAVSDRVLIDAARLNYPAEVILAGASRIDLNGFAAAVDAKALTGALSVNSSAASTQTLYVETGTADTRVRVNNTAANAVVSAAAMVSGSTLTTEGDGSVQVSALGVDLINSARNGSVVSLRRQDVAGEFRLKITSASSLTVDNGSLDPFDLLTLDGSGANSSPDFTVLHLIADLDAALTVGALAVSTARLDFGNSLIDIATGRGDVRIETPTAGPGDDLDDFKGDIVEIDATRLDKQGGRLELSGDSSLFVLMSASAAGGQYEMVSSSDFEVDAAPTVLAADSINLQVEQVQDDRTLTLGDSPNRFEIRGLAASLDARLLSRTTAAVDVALFDRGFDPEALTQTLQYGGSVQTGAGNDHLRFEHAYVKAGGDAAILPVTPDTGAVFDLGGGYNEVHVGRGVAAGALFDLSRASFAATGGGALGLVISDDGMVQMSSAQLQPMTAGTAVFTDFREAMDGVNAPIDPDQQAFVSEETILVDTSAGALGEGALPSYLLDEAIEHWVIGVTGGGNNAVTLGRDGQTARFGAGLLDAVQLNRRSAGDLIGVERVIVGGAGSSIADAGVTSDEANNPAIGKGQLSAGVVIDFENGASRLLELTVAQHRSLATGAAVIENIAGGQQGLSLRNGTIDLDPRAVLVPNVAGLPGIEGYALGDSSLVSPAYVKVNPLALFDGTNYARDYGGLTDLSAINDFSQGDDTILIQGGEGNDVIRTSGNDAKRGALQVDLSSGGQDLVFVYNGWIGNTYNGGLAVSRNGGFGGEIVDHSGVFANGLTFQATSSIWAQQRQLGQSLNPSGTKATLISGFSTDVNDPDKIAMIGEQLGADYGAEMVTPDFIEDITELVAPLPTANLILEFSAGLTGSIDSAFDLDKVAELLVGAVGNKASTNGVYYLILYSDESESADAWLYSALATASDGFDFSHAAGGFSADRDTLELIAIFSDVGANSFSSSNLAWFSAPQLILLPS